MFTAGSKDKSLDLSSGNERNADIRKRENEYSPAMPVWAELPVKDHDDERPEDVRMYEDTLESPVMDIPFHSASPCPNLALKSPAIRRNDRLCGSHTRLPEKRSGIPNDPAYVCEAARESDRVSPALHLYFRP